MSIKTAKMANQFDVEGIVICNPDLQKSAAGIEGSKVRLQTNKDLLDVVFFKGKALDVHNTVVFHDVIKCTGRISGVEQDKGYLRLSLIADEFSILEKADNAMSVDSEGTDKDEKELQKMADEDGG